MTLSQNLSLKQSQLLLMTPQLQQAIKLLQLSNIEVVAYIEKEMEKNPLLKFEDKIFEDNELPVIEDEVVRENPVIHSSSVFHSKNTLNEENNEHKVFSNDHSFEDWYSNSQGLDIQTDTRSPELKQSNSLRDHLYTQLNVAFTDKSKLMIGYSLIDSLDDDGYLSSTVDDISEQTGFNKNEILIVLEKCREFDPVGVFASDLADCFSMQLADRDRLDPVMKVFLENLDLMLCYDILALQSVCRVDRADIMDIISELKLLNPKPGLVFQHEITEWAIPDIIVYPNSKGGWFIELNNECLPPVVVDKKYYDELSKNNLSKKDKRFMRENLQSANWLVKSLDQRSKTILKVMTEIVKNQDDFFQFGVSHLKPLVLNDIAKSIKVHESTVSRVTSNKYVMTPRGVFELKYFFTNSISSIDPKKVHSSESVRTKIKELIESETISTILSDDRIVEILKLEGINIARRTVAKYRASLHIASSTQRRRKKLAQPGV
ncbi:MAG: RNA polymerase factor sigma-54 [Alphaproteobacteria bacterium]|nr:RNA polymerase factor sigma-54 [Alphaproteobacteria bacterium]